jgi:hypothetical protein
MRETVLIQKIQKLADLSRQLRRDFLTISKILLFPTIKNLIQTLFEFETKEYLEILVQVKDYHFLSVKLKSQKWTS